MNYEKRSNFLNKCYLFFYVLRFWVVSSLQISWTAFLTSTFIILFWNLDGFQRSLTHPLHTSFFSSSCTGYVYVCLAVVSLRVYCTWIRIWLMNVLWWFAYSKTCTHNAFYSLEFELEPIHFSYCQYLHRCSYAECELREREKNVPWNTCSTYIFITLMDFHIASSLLPWQHILYSTIVCRMLNAWMATVNRRGGYRDNIFVYTNIKYGERIALDKGHICYLCALCAFRGDSCYWNKR